jgi:hypothetical protein
MLPFVLGGIALAAVGYGLKEYCEEMGCPWESDTTPAPEASHPACEQKLQRAKRDFYAVLEREYLPLISDIRGYDPKALKYPDAPCEQEVEDVSGAVKEEMESLQCGASWVIAQATQRLQDDVKSVLSDAKEGLAYDALDGEQREALEHAERLVRNVTKLCHKKILTKEHTISKKYLKLMKKCAVI